MRKKYLYLSALLPVTGMIVSCDKNVNMEEGCFKDRETIRVLNAQPATVKLGAGIYYLVEDFTYDTKLIPCELPEQYRMHDLRVRVSGDVKTIPRPAIEPCCTDGLVITGIKSAED